MLRLVDVGYRYAGFARPALEGVSLDLANGEIVGLVGPNDAGKSTLCLVASGLAPGSIGGELAGGGLEIDGESMAGKALHDLSTRVGIAFQNPVTQLSSVAASVFEEVALGPMNLGLSARETVARTKEALGTVRIEHLAERGPRRLSGGEIQLVVLASLLAMRPRHLVLDEPTAQLDPEGTRMVGDALRRVASAGTALLIAEHKTDLLLDVCDRVIVIEDGRLVAEGPADTVLADPELENRGVEPPTYVRLQRAMTGAGLDPTELPQ